MKATIPVWVALLTIIFCNLFTIVTASAYRNELVELTKAQVECKTRAEERGFGISNWFLEERDGGLFTCWGDEGSIRIKLSATNQIWSKIELSEARK